MEQGLEVYKPFGSQKKQYQFVKLTDYHHEIPYVLKKLKEAILNMKLEMKYIEKESGLSNQ